MFFKQFYLGCLAHASYMVGSDGEAAVIDPQRDVAQYLEEAAARGLRIEYVIETHLHADFVSGHRELAEATGATVVMGRQAEAEFPHLAVGQGDELRVGRLRLRVLETPGHTPESISVLLTDPEASDQPAMVFTGDTLFVGDVGRPDLAGARGWAPETLAGLLYDSLHEKLLSLDDGVRIYPAHGAGSLCGRNISTETSSTIGEQKRYNPALQPMSREDFVRMATADLPTAPGYFSRDAELNRRGAGALGGIPAPTAMAPEAFRRRMEEGARVLDVRPAAAFGQAHLPGAINLGLSGQFASWAGALLEADVPLLLVAEGQEAVDEAVVRLARVGIDSVAGFLEGGLDAWRAAGLEVDTVPQMTVDELEQASGLQIVDVRRPHEYASGHVPGAVSLPLDRLQQDLGGLDPSCPTAVVCASGYRSSAASGLLKRAGLADVRNVTGGTTAWVQSGRAVEATVAAVRG